MNETIEYFRKTRNYLLLLVWILCFIISIVPSNASQQPLISQISILPPTPTNNDNLTGHFIVFDTDTTDTVFNNSWFESQTKNVSLLVSFDTPLPVNLIDNSTLSMSGFTTYNGQMGNATVGDSAEPTIVAGKYGRGMGFDGVDDNIRLQPLLIMSKNNTHSVSMWFYLGGWNNDFNLLIDNAYSTSDRVGISLTNTTSPILAVGSYNGTLYTTKASSTALSRYAWHHVFYTYNITNIVLYVDGVLQTGTTQPALSGTAGLIIGSGNDFLNKYLNGTLDNIEIYPCSVSSSSQINRSMNSAFPIDFTSEGGCAPSLFYGFENVGNGYVNDTNYLVSDGKGTGAYNLDGVNDYITANIPINISSNNFSISMYFNGKELGDVQDLFYFGGSDNLRFGLYKKANNKLSFEWYNGSAAQYSADFTTLTSNANYKLDVTKSGWNTTLYLNGVLQNSFNVEKISIGQLKLQLGLYNNIYPFNGSIDNVKIYNYALSPSQILSDYNAWLNNQTITTLVSDETSIGEQWRYCTRPSDFFSYSEKNCTSFVTILDCIPLWTCSNYSKCTITDFKDCNNVSDSNICNEIFTGNLNEYSSYCSYCSDNENTTVCSYYKQQGDFNMLGPILLFLGLWTLGYYMTQTGNSAFGFILIMLTIPIDIYFAYIFKEELNLGTGFIGVMATILPFLTIASFFLLKIRNDKKTTT